MGVLAIDTASAPFSVEILLAIEQCAEKYGWDHFVVNISSGDDPVAAVRQILSRRPDGIIITSAELREINIPELLRDRNLVLTNCYDPEIQRYRLIFRMIIMLSMMQQNILFSGVTAARFVSGRRRNAFHPVCAVMRFRMHG